MAGVRAGTTADSERGVILRHQHDLLHKRIDRHCDDLLGNLEQLVRAAVVQEQPGNDLNVFQLDVVSTNIVTAAQELLVLITELKHNALLHDFAAVNDEVRAESAKLQAASDAARQSMTLLADDVEIAVRELEQQVADASAGLHL